MRLATSRTAVGAPAVLGAVLALLGIALSFPEPAQASLAATGTSGFSLSTERVVEGRVSRLESRIDPLGYPITDVVLEPGGERFSILGGYKDGLLWVVDEEASFSLGERVRVRLQSGRDGYRPVGGREAVEHLDRALSLLSPNVTNGGALPAPYSPADIPHVEAVTPSSGPAVADTSIEVVVTGTGFGETRDTSGVFFQGLFEHVPARVLSWSDTRIVCLVPKPGKQGEPQVLSGSVKVWTPAGGWSDGDQWRGGAEYHVLFQYAGDNWTESRLPVPFYINPWKWSTLSPQAVTEVVLRAAQTWHEAPFAYGRFRFLGYTEKRAMRDKDSLNVIGWTSPWPHIASWLAVTWSGIDSASGERHEVDVEINGDRDWSTADDSRSDAYDLQTTMAHEFGHWLRLGHVQEPGHLMLAYQNLGEIRRTLAEGERQGASWIYPTYGHATASRDTVRSGLDTLVLSVQIADRRGRPMSRLLASEVRATPKWLDAGTEEPTSGPGAFADLGILHPESDTDEQGRTRIVIPSIEGWGRVQFTVEGNLGYWTSLREQPIVFVAGSPPPGMPALSLSGPRPNPAVGPIQAVARLRDPSPRLLARVLDARGRVTSVLFDGPAPAGIIQLAWNPGARGPAAAGLYFLEVRGAGAPITRKFVLLGR